MNYIKEVWRRRSEEEQQCALLDKVNDNHKTLVLAMDKNIQSANFLIYSEKKMNFESAKALMRTVDEKCKAI